MKELRELFDAINQATPTELEAAQHACRQGDTAHLGTGALRLAEALIDADAVLNAEDEPSGQGGEG